MEAALEAARAKDTKERLAGVERLHEALDAAARRGLTAAEVTALVDTCMDLTRDANFRIAQGGLQALSVAAVVAGDHFKIHLNALVPAAVERLGDDKQPVHDAARQLLITLMEVSSPTIIVERAGSYAWTHKSWRVRDEFVRTVASAVGLFASTEISLQRVLLSPVLQLMNDSNQSVRDAAISCIEEMYKHMGSQFHEELQRHNLPSYMLKEINSRLDKIEPKVRSSDTTMQYKAVESRGNAGMEPVGSGTPSGSVNDMENEESGSKGKRPLGRDSTKASRKKAMSSSSQSTNYLSRIHDIQIARLKQSEEKSELKQQNIEFMKEVELKKLEFQSKKIEMQQTKLMMEDRIRKDEELNKMYAMDMDALPEELRAVYIARRKGLIDYFIKNPV